MNEPDVVLTDAGLAVLGFYLGWRLWTLRDRGVLQTAGAVLMAGLASAAFWGAVFHALFREGTATTVGFVFWVPVALSILTVAATMIALSLRVLAPRLGRRPRRAVVAAYAVAFAGAVLLIDESFTMIVRFYGPALVLVLTVAAWQARRTASRGWRLIAVGFAVSAVAAVLRQAGVALHAVYFDHNALYHVVQAAASVLLFIGFRHAPAMPAPVHAR